MSELKLGVVSCLHGNLAVAEKIVERFERDGVDAVALIGDIPSDRDQEKNFREILELFSELGVRVFVVPGSHEHYEDYYSALEDVEGDFLDCSEIQKHDVKGRELVFLPGSSVSATDAGFRLLPDREAEEEFRSQVEDRPDHYTGKIVSIFAEDVKELCSPDSVLITHDPPNFSGKDAVDLARYGEAEETFEIDEKEMDELDFVDNRRIESGWPFPVEQGRKLKELGYPFEIKENNVGDEFLNDIMEETGIKKLVCGHIHEAGGKAVDREGKPVEEALWSEEMIYNCAAGKEGMAGIVEFREDEALYINLELV